MFVAKFELSRLASYTDADLVAEIRRVAGMIPLGGVSKKEFDSLARCSSSVVSHRFGSWKRALALAGVPERYTGGSGARGKKERMFSDEELIAELRSVSTAVGSEVVTVEQFQKHGRMNAETVRLRFGSWGKALQQAGLRISNLGRRYSDDEYFENLLAVWTHYGRQPTYGEMTRPPSKIPSGAYETKWGTWRKALLAFQERAERDDRDDASPHEVARASAAPPNVPSVRAKRRRCGSNGQSGDRRQPSLGLRYRVLRRDRFMCVLCGANPATNTGCELHVDHIVAFSRGGRTVFENLRTLCDRCNLGKGSHVEESPSGARPAGSE